MPRRGLPESTRMRHDAHYVEALAASSGAPVGRMVPIGQIDPNPDQPRQLMGDLSEMMASIAEKGILEPLIVRQQRGRFQIIAGERRYQASVQVGLEEIPVIIRDVDDRELIELALIENIQRKDLTAFEEAESIGSLSDKFQYTHEELAKRLGKSRTAITELLALNNIPEATRKFCILADINSKSILLQIARERDPDKMLSLAEKIAKGGMTRADVRRAKIPNEPMMAKPFSFKYVAPSKSFKLRLDFQRSKVNRGELIQAVEEILTDLRKQSD